jgi:hypothetical protein
VPIYECKPCEGEGKIYETNSKPNEPYQCVCDRGENFLEAGDICLRQQAVQDGVLQDYPMDNRIAYDGQNIQNSDVMRQLYMKSAYRCRVNKSPKDC